MAQEKEVKAPQTTQDLEKKLAALQYQLEAANKKVAQAEEEALDKVCVSLGIDPASIKIDETKRPVEQIVEYDIGPTEVAINGVKYTGRGKAMESVAETVIHMAATKRERELKARIGGNYAVETGFGGALAIRKLNEDHSQV